MRDNGLRLWRILLGLAAVAAACGRMPSPPQQTGPTTYRVTVNADGSFSPQKTTLRDGDTVEWVMHDRYHDAIVRSDGATCGSVRAHSGVDPNELTGPMPRAASGIFTLSPLGPGHTFATGTTCPAGQPKTTVGNEVLCVGAGPLGATMDATWQDPQLSGVIIRLLWNELQLAPGQDDASFDFTILDREVDQAVKNGKLYTLSVKAGDDGTPTWLFTTGNVPRLTFEDSGSDGDAMGCGKRMNLGNPTDARYQQHYFDMLTKVGRHLRARGDRWRALAAIKPSGANLFSHENRLPKRCEVSCICNTQVWAGAGYTPSKLYEFYKKQEELMVVEFPGKDISYALIQDGFPLVNEAGDYEMQDGKSSGGKLPGGLEQTETILAQGQAAHGLHWLVQHNGLGPRPPSGTCPNEGIHPTPRIDFASAGSGCPNRWVLRADSEGQLTGYQTNNGSKVSTPQILESTVQNQWDNSDGVWLEIYEDLYWEVVRTSGGVLDPAATGRTLQAWAEQLHQRRRDLYPTVAEPFPALHRHTFKRTLTDATTVESVHYLHASKCATGGSGVIEILP